MTEDDEVTSMPNKATIVVARGWQKNGGHSASFGFLAYLVVSEALTENVTSFAAMMNIMRTKIYR
jgi:hypothetical protein